MKWVVAFLAFFSAVVVMVFSCKREKPATNATNQPPISKAGTDQRDTAAGYCSQTSSKLDGSNSHDPDGTISTYLWTKIAGPSSYTIVNPSAVKTDVNNLTIGTYQFELKVTDNGDSTTRDTVQITVTTPSPAINCDNNSRPLVNATLVPIGTLSELRRDIPVASAGNKILFAGGDVGEIPGSTLDIYTSRVDIYDIETQTWSTAELSFARDDMATVTSGNRIFFGGGEYGDGGYCSDVVDIYDASTNKWSVATLSTPRNRAAAAAIGTKVFFAGGCASNAVDIYDQESDRWSTVELSQHKWGIVATTVGNKIFFAGGVWIHDSPEAPSLTDRIDIYDDLTGSWSTCTLVEPKVDFTAISVNGKLFWAGGGNDKGISDLIEIVDLSTGNAAICHLSSPAGYFPNSGWRAAEKDGKIIFPLTGTNKFDIYNTATNTWSIGVLPVTLADASIISVNNTIYIGGGYVNGTLSNQVWKLEF